MKKERSTKQNKQNKQKTRLFVTSSLGVGGRIKLSAGQVHKLRTVLRLKEGDRVSVFNGCDGEWSGYLLNMRQENVQVCLLEQIYTQTPEKDLWLLFAPLKQVALTYLIEKATELGVSRFVPVLTERSIVRRINYERLYKNAVEASEQSDRLSIPEFARMTLLKEVLSCWSEGRSLFVCAECGPSYPMIETFLQYRDRLPAILSGPEGGFSATEFDVLSTYSFTIPIHLGARILRAETAASAALTGWQASVGAWV